MISVVWTSVGITKQSRSISVLKCVEKGKNYVTLDKKKELKEILFTAKV